MPRILRRTLGAVAALIGLAGTLFSVVAVVQSWALASRLGREIPQAVADLERVVASVQSQGGATLGLIDAARGRIRFVGETVDDLASTAGGRPDASPLLESLEPEIERRLEAAEAFILAMQESLRSLNRALVVLDAVPLLSRRIAPADGPDGRAVSPARPLAAVADSLGEAADLLDEAMLTLDRVRSGRAVSRRQLDQFLDRLDEVDRALEDARGQVGTFFDGLDQAGRHLARLRSSAPRWVRRGAWAASAFFTCFAASQLALVGLGWTLLARGPGASRWHEAAGAGIVSAEAPPPAGGAADHPHREDDRCTPPSPSSSPR